MKLGAAVLGFLIIVLLVFQAGSVIAPATAPEQLQASGHSQSLSSPSDWIREDQVRVYPDKVVIEIPNAVWARFTPTHSMDPVLSDTAHALQIVPRSESDISVGDIVSFWSSQVNANVIHRVIEIGSDDQGWFAVTKGDNNPHPDPGVRRFRDISRVLVAVIY